MDLLLASVVRRMAEYEAVTRKTDAPGDDERMMTSPRETEIEQRVLVVDDDRDFADSMADLLRSAGYAVRVAYSAEMALGEAASFEPQVVMVDVRLGRSDGIALVRSLKERDSDLACLVMTAYAELDTAISAIKSGVHDFLTKPVDEENLFAILDRCFAIWRVRAQRDAAIEALRRSEGKYRQIVETAYEGIWIVNGCHETVFANARMAELLQTTPEELLGKTVFDFVEGDWVREARRRFERRQRGIAEQYEFRFRRADGSELWAIVNASPILDEEGDYAGSLGMLTDMTEYKTLEAQLREVQKMDAIGKLADGVAHDFNNLLTSILGYTELARATLPEDHEALASLSRVEESAEQASEVTRALLAFSHKLPAEKQPTDAQAVLSKTYRLLRRVLPNTIEVVMEAEEGTPVWIDADGSQIQQALMNLAINAREAMPKGGRLTLSLAHEEVVEPNSLGWAVLRVSDTGEGMSDEVLERVFEPFFTTKRPGEATGLGLAVVHGIVMDHKGEIGAVSSPGEGTTFTIKLPVSRPHVSDATVRTASPAGAEVEEGGLLLIAEDNRHVRAIIVTALRAMRHEIVQVGDGQALLDAVAEHGDAIRLMIVDVELPRRSGLECVRALRASGDTTPVILITARYDVGLDDEADEQTIVLRKPFQIVELSRLVQGLLAGVDDKKDGLR